MQGETVVYEAKLHGIVYLPPILVAAITIVLCAAVPSDATAMLAFIVIAVCAMWCTSIYGGRQFVLTTKRVIVKEGIIKREVSELMLRKCEGIKVEQSIMGRILGYGTLLVTTGEATNYYKKIKDPITFSTRINEQIDMLK